MLHKSELSMESLLLVLILLYAAMCTNVFDGDQQEDFKPNQIHISFGEKSNDIVVTWSTKQDPKETSVKYGAGNLEQHAKGGRTLFIDGGSLKATQFIHRVELNDLKYDTNYEYLVGSHLGWSEQLTFKTAPAGQNWVVKALVFGDLGVDGGQTMSYMIDEVKHNHYDTIIHAGDIAYDMNEQNGTSGDRYLNQIQSMASKVPYMVAPGNHEAAYNFSHYKARFSMPNRDEYDNMYYSFNLGPIHFVSINTEPYYDDTDYPGDDSKADPNQIHAQYHWLKNDLDEATKAENRAKRPWIILYGHRTMLCSNSLDADRCMIKGYEYPHRIGSPLYGGYGLEVLLKNYGVDLSIWAHQHSYERLWPMYNKKVYNGSLEQPYVNPQAPVHITTGAAGSRESTDDFVKEKPEWSAFRNSDYGYARMTVLNRTHLFFEQVVIKNNAMVPIDSFILVRDEHKPFLQ